MASYSELMAQAQTLMAQAEQARKDELAGVIGDIKAKMKQYGITVADLGGGGGGAKKAGNLAIYTSAQTDDIGALVTGYEKKYGVKVSVYRQVNTEGTWTDAAVDSETGQQLENKILERARLLKASEIS